MTTRLDTELALLVRCEQQYGVRTASIIAQLIADDLRLLPDVFPVMPQWTTAFKWPRSGEVNYVADWRRLDAVRVKESLR